MNKRITWRKVAFWSSMVALPSAVTALGSRRSKLLGGVAGGLTAVALAGLRWQFQRFFTEEPSYDVEQRIGPLEIRRVAAHVEARTRVLTDDHDTALETGFRRLAEYIFGGNHPDAHPTGHWTDRSSRLADTLAGEITTSDPTTILTPEALAAPADKPEKSGERIAMTAPVINQKTGVDHVMSFVMPSDRDLGSLPKPNDDRVELENVPEKRFAVLTYRGRYTAEAVRQHEEQLLAEAEKAGLHTIGVPLFAGFDPPNTIPWLRRNEVWIQVA